MDSEQFYWAGPNQEFFSKRLDPIDAPPVAISRGIKKSGNAPPGYTLMTMEEFRKLLDGKDTNLIITELVADESRLYWVLGSAGVEKWLLLTMPKQGGQPLLIAEDPLMNHIAVDSENVFWSAIGGGTCSIKMRSKSKGEKPRTIYNESTSGEGGIISNIAIDKSYVYFVNHHSLGKVPKDGGTFVAIDSDIGNTNIMTPPVIAVDDNNIYLAVSGSRQASGEVRDDGVILNIPKNGGKRSTLARLQGSITDLVLDRTNVYWISCSSKSSQCEVLSILRE